MVFCLMHRAQSRVLPAFITALEAEDVPAVQHPEGSRPGIGSILFSVLRIRRCRHWTVSPDFFAFSLLGHPEERALKDIVTAVIDKILVFQQFRGDILSGLSVDQGKKSSVLAALLEKNCFVARGDFGGFCLVDQARLGPLFLRKLFLDVGALSASYEAECQRRQQDDVRCSVSDLFHGLPPPILSSVHHSILFPRPQGHQIHNSE